MFIYFFCVNLFQLIVKVTPFLLSLNYSIVLVNGDGEEVKHITQQLSNSYTCKFNALRRGPKLIVN